jgi:hypothetical protein
MNILTEFLAKQRFPELRESVRRMADSVICKAKGEVRTGLLLGEIQSGKTAHLLGCAANAADKGFQLCIILTSDNTELVEQTYRRCLEEITENGVGILRENEESYKLEQSLKTRPAIAILPKNKDHLPRWNRALASIKGGLDSASVLIIDDEADAASLNTRVNKGGKSTIYSEIKQLRSLGQRNIYLQVTATAYANMFLLGEDRPQFWEYFPPGQGYIGAEAFLRDGGKTRILDKGEKGALETGLAPEGLQDAIRHYLLSSVDTGWATNNMLIHHDRQQRKHKELSGVVTELLESWQRERETSALEQSFQGTYQKGEFQRDFAALWEGVKGLLINNCPQVVTYNAKTKGDRLPLNIGSKVIIGGDCFSRGITIPRLHVMYYMREAKTPQFDTVWQHSRLFGYDRSLRHIRLYITEDAQSLLESIFRGGEDLKQALRENYPDGFPEAFVIGNSSERARLTRRGVTDETSVETFWGGKSYFTSLPLASMTGVLDGMLGPEGDRTIGNEEAQKLLSAVRTEATDPFPRTLFLKALRLQRNRGQQHVALHVRTGRAIGRGTGAMLDPKDQATVKRDIEAGHTSLTFYRISGEESKGWDGNARWMANIAFPKGAYIGQKGSECGE